MGVIEDVFKALERIPIWARLQKVPSELDDLTRRIAALEEQLGGKHAPDVCKFCGSRAARMTASLGPDAKGKLRQHWTCGDCRQVEVRLA